MVFLFVKLKRQVSIFFDKYADPLQPPQKEKKKPQEREISSTLLRSVRTVVQ